MSFIPNTNLFLIGSCINALDNRFYSNEQRFEQTLMTLDSVNKADPKSIIVLADASITPLTDQQIDVLKNRSSIMMDLSGEASIRTMSKVGAKSIAEGFLLFTSLSILKQQPWFKDVKRVFKVSARSWLEPEFDLSAYDNMFGKYVFKKRIPTWMAPGTGPDHLLITRMFSLCPSLVDNYLQVIDKNMPLLNYMDAEHAHFANIPKEYLVEFDNIHCSGFLAGNGTVEKY